MAAKYYNLPDKLDTVVGETSKGQYSNLNLNQNHYSLHDQNNVSLDSLTDNVDAVDAYQVGDRIRVTNETYKKPIAQVGGYEFKWAHAVTSTGEHYWNCVNYFKRHGGRCPAVIYTTGKTSESTVERKKNHHNHAADAVAVENRLLRNRGRHLVRSNPQLPKRRVIAQVSANASDALRSRGTANMERLVRRHRQRERNEPPVSRTSVFEIPEEHKTMDDGSPFVMHDSSVDNREYIAIDGRIIILGCRQTLDMLANATNIGGDGSFSRAPAGFMQFYLFKNTFSNVDKHLQKYL